MYPLETGQDAEMAREKLNLTQQEMANSVGISLRTWRRQATSDQLDLTISLAIECLLRRRAVSSQTAVTPEERAERKFREQRRLLELRRAAGLPAGRASLTPA
ncbi:MAG: hypothetical protein KGL39_41525, partial [Patescibacteria group bacterium]|nr:hypothetical protein [Patescibacteria group bacterium]